MDAVRMLFAVVFPVAIVWMETAAALALPAAIQTCVDTSVCTMPLVVDSTATTTVSTYRIGATEKFLFAYRLGVGSYDGGMPLAGSLWVSTQANFDLREDLHTFDLYFDHVIPLPQNLWIGDSDGLDVQLGLSSSALLSGQGRLLFEDNGAQEANMATLGDLFGMPIGNFMQSFVPCVAATCAVEARFNLVGYRYVSSADVATLELNPHDGQGIVYLQRQEFSGSPSDSPRTQIYSTVPAPGSLMLCAGAVCALMLRVRRRFVPTTSSGAAISAQAARFTPLSPCA